ncbi:histidine phosphatase family protein [Endozoicomonas sp.]|uniref:histidine phosphatase family protein n=1 Tax=Endozoicomonas sp. TaxID=1892382 RepID=UPI0028870091|nr:histidine phosphatase family protein [Endozoicomonas sp.]
MESLAAEPEREASGGIVFLRHGEGEHNVEKIYSSNPENPGYKAVKLTEHGREQVRETSDRLFESGVNGDTICKVIVSPLPRTIETADILMGKLQVARFQREVDPRAIEADAGERDGQAYLKYKDPDCWFPEHPERFGWESRSKIGERMASLIKSIVNDKNCDLSQQYVLIVSHGSPLLLAQEFLGLGDERLETAGYRIIPYAQIQKIMNSASSKASSKSGQ